MADAHDNFEGRSPAVVAVTIVFIATCTLFVFLRMISRVFIKKKLALDDYFIVAAWAIAVGIASAICYGCAWGLGRHEVDIPAEWQVNLRIADYVFSVLYQPALMATKTSILAFYLSLPTLNKNFRWACWATLFVVNAGGLALGLFTIFQCNPVTAAWRMTDSRSAHCANVITIYLSSTPLNIITDLALLFLPMPILTGIRLPRKQKIILVVTFSFGAFVAAVDVIRLVYLETASLARLHEIYQGTQNDASTNLVRTDFSWYASLSFMWSAIEVDTGIMVACVPGLKPLVSRFLPYMLRDKSDPTSKNNSFSSYNGNVDAKASPPTPSPPPQALHHEVVESQEDAEDDQMGMMDFLTTPDMTELPETRRTDTMITNTSRDTQRPSTNFFNFVDMKGAKSLVQVSTKESIFPISMVTILFFIWGFEYGLLGVLNAQFQRAAHMSATQSTSIHSAYYAGYFFGPLLVGRLVLKHWGFKACYTVGLCIYGCGTLIFWPAAVLTSFPAFVITNFIVAFGLSILEVSANPFITLCGPPQYGEIRLNLSQGVQAIGSVVAPLIADKAFIHRNLQAPSLVDTQWAYLGISLFTILLAVLYYYVPLPEGTDAELEEAAERIDGANKAKIGTTDIIWITLAFGVLAQFCNVGAQEVNSTSFNSYVTVVTPSFDVANWQAIAHTAFAAARFAAAGLGFFIKPRVLILICFTGTIVFGALAMNLSGSTGVAMLVMVFFFEGPLFPLIFAQSLRGMGRHTKDASVLITCAISGGSVFAPASSHIINSEGRVQFALVIAVAVYAFGMLFPIWLNMSPLARRQCDPVFDDIRTSEPRLASANSRPSEVFNFLHLRKRTRKSSSDAAREQKMNDDQ